MHVDIDDFTRGDIAHQLETEHVERNAFGGQHPFRTLRRLALPEHQRADAVRIAQAQQPMADDHGDDGVTAAAAPIHRADRGENVGRRDARRTDALQLGGEHVEQDFRIGTGVEVAAILAFDDFGEFARVGEIAVVREADAVRRVDVERLGFRGAVASGGRIAHVAHAHVALELLHVVLLEHVTHQAAPLAHEQLAVEDGGDARRVLPPVLEHRERIIDSLIDSAGSDDPGYAAHSFGFLRWKRLFGAIGGARVCRQQCRAARRRRRWHRASASNSSTSDPGPC